ncbi:MAG: hypothetical protein IRZ31_20100 [Thermogemmatispora sp.]|uniref:DNA polymerase n=2 Tax=Thermogemmatispora sp. TaxID=1968838 RepID=UPI0026390DC3|nr:DNA polymerase [Thermogemmatispora sp.]MBX5459202.1 hypothetical protein [Thermogemmatispora sp.]
MPDGSHRYVLLCASTGETLWNEEGLSTAEIFTWLASLARRYPRAIFCGFATSYDVNCWLASLSRADVEQLWHSRDNGPGGRALTLWIDNRLYELSYRPRKQFTLRQYVEDVRHARFRVVDRHDRHTGRRQVRFVPNYAARLTVWDCFGFFQTSFVQAIRDWLADSLDQNGRLHLPDGMIIDMGHMAAMKTARHSFRTDEREQIIRYCLDECRVLVALMNRLRSLLTSVGIHLQRWDGAGAIAAALLRQHRVKEALDRRTGLPVALRQAVRSAYAGGRIELLQCGTRLGPVYNYDLRSAYPSIMPELPRLADGVWRYHRGPLSPSSLAQLSAFSIYHVRWDLAGPSQGSHATRRPAARAYPFFWRAPDGSIYFPPRGEGWHWSPEVLSAFRALDTGTLTGCIEILEAWEFRPGSAIRPFEWVRDLFDLRQQWKREGRPEERVLKLGLNSLYGKLAQAKGGTADEPPTWHSLEWAGYITSRVRAKIFDAMMLRPEALIMTCTDGLYSTEPLPGMDIGPQLGQWEDNGQFTGIIAVQAGVYWTLVRPLSPNEVERLDEERAHLAHRFDEFYLCLHGQWYQVAPHYRGFDPGTLFPHAVLDGWHQQRLTVTATTTRFVTMGTALRSEWKDWRRWVTTQRELSLFPTGKRVLTDPTILRESRRLSHSLHPTDPTPVDMGEPYPVSAAYQPRFSGETEQLAHQWEDELMIDLDLWEQSCE